MRKNCEALLRVLASCKVRDNTVHTRPLLTPASNCEFRGSPNHPLFLEFTRRLTELTESYYIYSYSLVQKKDVCQNQPRDETHMAESRKSTNAQSPLSFPHGVTDTLFSWHQCMTTYTKV